jgi:hypothetical protein
MITGSYRQGSYEDPKVFAYQLGQVMQRYSEYVIKQVSDVTYSGSVQKKYPDWPPSIGQITEVLDAEMAYQERLAKSATTKRFIQHHTYVKDWYPGCFAKVHIHPDSAYYEPLRAAVADGADSKDWRWVDGGWDDGGGLWVSVSLLHNFPLARFGPKPVADYAAGLDEKYRRKPAEEITT